MSTLCRRHLTRPHKAAVQLLSLPIGESQPVVVWQLQPQCSASHPRRHVVVPSLSTIRNADKIVVMSDGKIVEQGTHAELTAKPAGLYKDMWQQQSLKNEVAIV